MSNVCTCHPWCTLVASTPPPSESSAQLKSTNFLLPGDKGSSWRSKSSSLSISFTFSFSFSSSVGARDAVAFFFFLLSEVTEPVDNQLRALVKKRETKPGGGGWLVARNMPPYSILSTIWPAWEGIMLSAAATQSPWETRRKLRRIFWLLLRYMRKRMAKRRRADLVSSGQVGHWPINAEREMCTGRAKPAFLGITSSGRAVRCGLESPITDGP
mmetsp:Transcript_144475/g.402486  ORF Transcript_144475/g.402486 Transcript_144475/m.402486 type:complete len:214 (+) Transcript_144475:613-1254(+)